MLHIVSQVRQPYQSDPPTETQIVDWSTELNEPFTSSLACYSLMSTLMNKKATRLWAEQ